MTLKNSDHPQPTVYNKSHSRGNGVSNFLSGVAVLLSTLALLFSGFTAYQVFTLQQTLNAGANLSSGGDAPNQPYPPQRPSAVPEGANTAPVNSPPGTTSTAITTNTTGIQRSQFVQPAFRNKGQVELLKVNRVPGQPDFVNVQMRVRVLRPQAATGSDAIYVGGTTARNPQTSETYEAVKGESTGSVSLFSMRLENQTSADAYVWLRVPEGVNILNIYVPDTQVFQNVPISS